MGIGVGAAVLGAGVLGAGASMYGASEQAGAAKDATQAQMYMYNQTRGDLMPYMEGGSSAFSQLQKLLGLGGGDSSSMLQTLRNTPGYQFALTQGQQGLDRSAAARGMLLSGGQLKDTMNYNQGMADQLYNNYANQLMGASTLGENAAAGAGTAATATGQGMANSIMAGGTAMASGVAGAANNIGSSLYQFANMNNNSLGTGPGYGPNGWDAGPDPWLDEDISDPRAKTEIRKIGKLDSGLPVYSYKLRGSQLPQIGVMSTDVRQVAPHAVRRASDGLDRVNYTKVSQLPAAKRAA